MGGPGIIDGETHIEVDNFYLCEFEVDGHKYSSAEKYFQCMKTLDPEEFKKIFSVDNPMKTWALGNQVTLRKDWESVKVQIMYEGNLAKFKQNPEIAELLLKTNGDVVFKGSTPFWNKWNAYIMQRIRAELRNNEEDKTTVEKMTKLMDSYAETKK